MITQTEETELWNQFLAQRTPELREKLVLQSVPLVHYLLGRMGFSREFGSGYEDLVNQGLLGLIDAVDHYDPIHGARFSTYASLRVRGKVLDYLRSSDWMSRSARTRVRTIQGAVSDLWGELRREPNEEEIAGRLKMDVDSVRQGLMDSNRTLVSLDALFDASSEDENSLHEMLADDKQEDPFESLEETELREGLIEALKRLNERERQVLSLYYFEELNFKEIGKVLNISESRVCQVHAKAVLSIKALLSHE